MKRDFIKDPDGCYSIAELKATHYYKTLYEQVTEKAYVSKLIKDLQGWKQNHIRHHSFFPFSKLNKTPSTSDYHHYIQWQNYTGKLHNYLDRSISYIFLRDLGKTLDSPETQSRVQSVVDSLKKQLIQSTSEKGGVTDPFSMAWVYRKAQEEGIESTLIWLVDKLKLVSSKIPEGMDADQAQRKLIKIIAGVFMHAVEEAGDDLSPGERALKLDQAIRLGYSYGLTYPFIDDLLDAKILSRHEEKQYSDLIRSTLIQGSVPEFFGWNGENKELIRYIHSELKDAFEYIKTNQLPETRSYFFEQAYVFFQSQEIDRLKRLSDDSYTNEDLYVPIILKSSSSRLIARSVISAPEDQGFDTRTFLYGIYNQLADDFADMFQDMEDGTVTPYTYYMKYHHTRKDLINPFELYWTVIHNLVHNVYHSDTKTCEIILTRAINGLKRFKTRMGDKKYAEVMELYSGGNPKFDKIIQRMVRKADNVDFFDKLLRDHMISTLRSDRMEQDDFLKSVKSVRTQINKLLPILSKNEGAFENESIISAANYSLEGDGKRLRPIVTWLMGIHAYGLDESSIIPLLRSLEYMHTASLIFDDLPSQDNASMRRGRATVHQVYNTAIAELTGLFLTQRAVEEQSSLEQFDSKTVLKLIQYSAQAAEKMCQGQAMDLDSKGKRLTVEQLRMICFYKTGIAFEASLILPAILAKVNELEMKALKKYACHAGIAFQIKDDLLDIQGDASILGKQIGKDRENNNFTFVSILGCEGARKEMWEQYCLAMEALREVPRNLPFLKHLMNYIIHRDH